VNSTPTEDYQVERAIYYNNTGLASYVSDSGWSTLETNVESYAAAKARVEDYIRGGTYGKLPCTFAIVRTEELKFQGLLDLYPGAAAAYSLRLLDKDYTGSAIRVRRATDNAEQDIGFDDNGDLDTTSLATFCSGTDGFVKTWYDQSGNANDLTQSAGDNQPIIYTGGAVVEQNGKVAIDFDGSNDTFDIDNTGLDIGNLSSFMVGKFDTTGVTQIMLSLSGGLGTLNKKWYMGYVAGGNINFGYGASATAFSTTANTNQNLLTMIAGSTQGNASAFLNSTSIGTATLTTGLISDQQTAVASFANYFYTNGNIQELIYYASDQSGNRTGIEDNINDYYSIYP
jgi:hypothetical protein